MLLYDDENFWTRRSDLTDVYPVYASELHATALFLTSLFTVFGLCCLELGLARLLAGVFGDEMAGKGVLPLEERLSRDLPEGKHLLTLIFHH